MYDDIVLRLNGLLLHRLLCTCFEDTVSTLPTPKGSMPTFAASRCHCCKRISPSYCRKQTANSTQFRALYVLYFTRSRSKRAAGTNTPGFMYIPCISWRS